MRAQSVSFGPGLAMSTTRTPRNHQAYTNFVYNSSGDGAYIAVPELSPSPNPSQGLYQGSSDSNDSYEQDYVLTYSDAVRSPNNLPSPIPNPNPVKKLTIVELSTVGRGAATGGAGGVASGGGGSSNGSSSSSRSSNTSTSSSPRIAPLGTPASPSTSTDRATPTAAFLRRELTAPSPSALSSLRAQQGRHLVGRPLHPSEGRYGGPGSGVPTAPYTALRLNIDEEWSGDGGEGEGEEIGRSTSRGEGQQLMGGMGGNAMFRWPFG